MREPPTSVMLKGIEEASRILSANWHRKSGI